MAITVSPIPTSPNLANGNLIFRADSNQVSQPQFQYVVDIKNSANVLIQRIKQQPNPQAYGIFDFSRIITTELGDTDKVWKITSATANTNCGNDFKVYFGEEYGTSLSSSVTLYNGITTGVTGSPAYTGSNQYYFMLDGVSNPNEKVNWNWDSGSKVDYVNPTADPTASYQNGLTNFTTQSVRSTDYHTISYLNGNMTGKANLSTSAQDVYIMQFKQYDVTGSLLSTSYIYNTAGPRTSPSDIWTDVYTSQSEDTRLIHFPTGPANLSISASTSYYVCSFHSQGLSGGLGNTTWGSYTFNIVNNCDYEGTRFAWKNEYGVWDYFNFTLAKDANTSISRKQYEQSFVNFAAANPTYDKSRRGELQYYNELKENYTAQSDWLTQEQADNLRELFYSTNVYVQDGTDYLPVVITNSAIEQKKNIRTQKLFRYTVQYQFANDLTPRR